MLVPLIDQFTLVLQPTIEVNYENWVATAEDITQAFLENSHLDYLFNLKEEGTLPSGYNTGLTTSESAPFYFAIAYHNLKHNMGIIVKFSAQAWYFYKKYYMQKFNKDISLWGFMDIVHDKKYKKRLSLVDMAIDYLDEGINIDSLYNSLINNRTVIRYANGNVNRSTRSPFIPKDMKVESFYIGAKKKNVNSLLRVYDKKQEQLENYGLYKDYAKLLNDWTRFEVSFRGHYAHQLSEKFEKIDSDQDEKNLITSSILDRYSFHYTNTGKYRKETKLLRKLLKDDSVKLSTPNTRIHSLERSYDYLILNSGLMSFLYKIKVIFGDKGIEAILQSFNDNLKNYLPTDDTKRWLDRYQSYYKDPSNKVTFVKLNKFKESSN